MDSCTSVLNGKVSLNVSNKFLRGIVMKAKRKSIDIAKILFSCLNLKIISPISEIIHIIGADLCVIIAAAVNRAYRI